MNVAVRAGTPDDIEPAITVWRVADTARRGTDPGDDRAAVVRERLAMPDRFLLIAERGGTIVGMATGMHGRDDDGRGPVIPGLCHIGLVFVVPEVRGHGIGGRLVDAVLAEARERGYDRPQLWTQADNQRALRLYTSRDFTRSGRTGPSEDGESIVYLGRGLA